MLVYCIEISGTPASGTYSFNTPKFDSAILKQIILKSASNDTVWDIRMIDDHNNRSIDTTVSGLAPTGTYNQQFDIPLKGIYSFYVLNSSADELFTGRLLVQEEA